MNKKEKKAEELRERISELEQQMDVCSYGKAELFELEAMKEELYELEEAIDEEE